MGPRKKIEVFDSVEILSAAAAHFICERAKAAIKTTGKFTIALSGGSTPEKLFAILAQAPYDTGIQWENVFVFWGDERCVPLDDERNNARMAKTLLLDKVDIPATNIYRIASDLAPEKGAKLYEDAIRYFFEGNIPSFDLVLLGLGENGHTASLFPYADVLHDKTHLVQSLFIDEQQMYRITMTAYLINMAHEVLFLAAGSGKAEILDTVIYGERDRDRYPAQMINPQSGGLYWYIDKDAAGKLREKQ